MIINLVSINVKKTEYYFGAKKFSVCISDTSEIKGHII